MLKGPCKNSRRSGSDEQLLRRVKGEYLEMPGLRLTREQAQRLWGLDEQTCANLLDVLVGLTFLVRDSAGRYMRLNEGTEPTLPLRMAKAVIREEPESARLRVGARQRPSPLS